MPTVQRWPTTPRVQTCHRCGGCGRHRGGHPDRPAGNAWEPAFPTFPYEVSIAERYAEAVARCGAGPRISRQSYGLRTKILQVEEQRRIRGFSRSTRNARSPQRLERPSSQKNWNGAVRRRTLLAGHGIELRDDLAAAGRVPVDDVLDAAAVAWTAGRIAPGIALCLPTGSTPAGRSPRRDLVVRQRANAPL